MPVGGFRFGTSALGQAHVGGRGLELHFENRLSRATLKREFKGARQMATRRPVGETHADLGYVPDGQ